MRYLLDTNVFLWAAQSPERLSGRVRAVLEDSETEAFVSHASVWEIAIKVSRGRLKLAGALADFLPRVMASHRLDGLPIELRHILAVADLPWLHRDPFDRLLVSQAQIEQMAILSADRAIAQYDVQVVW
ncbi:MAG TPA: type II toxin-antitoxin system VapC family toxin [Chloroflexota bacterium]